MTPSAPLSVTGVDLDAIQVFEGCVAVFLPEDGKLDQLARRVNRVTRGALERFASSEAFSKLKPGEAADLGWPAGMEATSLRVVRLDKKCTSEEARAAGASVGKSVGPKGALLLAGSASHVRDMALGAVLRAYKYTEMQSSDAEAPGAVTLMVSKPEQVEAETADVSAMAEGVFFTRDLVNKPSNVLTTEAFAEELVALKSMGVEVEVFEEDQMADLKMNLLLGVGQGSESPSKMVIMRWKGGEKGAAPLALIGKGVVFDTGGISLKPAGGMEDMTMDMGGAGVVAGVMKAIAGRKAPANVVGMVGLVENMPDGKAQRPGDVVESMKGDTVEVINTDAEGRLVLADVIWYAVEHIKPAGIVDLATLTGAIIVALGHENAGVFSNDDEFAGQFLSSAGAEGEGAWRMPLGKGYQKLLKSEIADLKNIGGRWGGAVTAAEFLHRFVPEDMPWIHLDIAGVAKPNAAPVLAPKGASGWGVLSLDRMIRDHYET